MQIYKEIAPRFVNEFSCTGTDCPMTCCQGWNIYIDKKTHLSYVNASNDVIAASAKEHLLLTRKGKNHYSVVKFNDQGLCPFVDEQQLCSIQREMGAKALSKTCSVYPRIKKEYLNATRHSMTLSCPEVVRLVLFDPQSMLLEERASLKAWTRKNQPEQRVRDDERSQIIHLFAWNIIKSPSLRVEENLMALAHFILYLQRIEFDVYRRLDDIEAYYHGLLDTLRAEETLLAPQHTAESVALKIKSLSVLGKYVASRDNRSRYIREGHRLLAEFIDPQPTSSAAALEEKFSRIEAQWQTLCGSSCLSAPHVLRNYLLYKIYHSNFPQNSLATLLRQFSLLVLDYFYIKQLIAVRSLNEPLTEEVVLKTIASFAEKTMHSSVIGIELNEALDMINSGDDLSCLLLLGQ
ncbi:flagellin lysine-N-methylase [Pluralibacter gergoviae]|nr:flagellin lysine-N-methylase [Pluralibacter gergoviae]ELW9442195.1 flagellin lysine-N-methylase [Pluralibacter gergoviae]